MGIMDRLYGQRESSQTSEFWRCPGCRGVLRKDTLSMRLWVEQRPGDSLGGFVTCGGCQSQYAFADIYGGRYDLLTINLVCRACKTQLRGPREELVGNPCPACGERL